MDLLLNATEAAHSLKISDRTLWSMTKAKQIPCVRIGNRVLYDPRDLLRWIDSQKEQPKIGA